MSQKIQKVQMGQKSSKNNAYRERERLCFRPRDLDRDLFRSRFRSDDSDRRYPLGGVRLFERPIFLYFFYNLRISLLPEKMSNFPQVSVIIVSFQTSVSFRVFKKFHDF